MTKFASSRLELQLLASICRKRNEKIAAKFLALDNSFWVYEPVVNALTRVNTLLKRKGSIPTLDALAEDPILSDGDRQILTRAIQKLKPITDDSDADIAFSSLRTYRGRRKLHEMGSSIQRYLETEEDEEIADIDETLQKLGAQVAEATVSHFSDKQIMKIGKNDNSRKAVKEMLYGDKPALIPTGFTAFDSMNGGLPEAGLFIAMAGTGGGKTVLGAQLLLNFTRIAKLSTCLVSLEMTDINMLGRCLSNLAEVPYNKIQQKALNANEKKHILRVHREFIREQKANDVSWDIYAPEEDSSIEELYMLLRPYKYPVIMVDYISLLKGVSLDDWAKFGDVARFCKVWSRTQKCLIVLLAQGSEDMQIRYSKAVVEHADNAWVWIQTKETRESGILDINQKKARNMNDKTFSIKQDLSIFKMHDLDTTETKYNTEETNEQDLDYLDDVNQETPRKRSK